jgi:hypothetical protein
MALAAGGRVDEARGPLRPALARVDRLDFADAVQLAETLRRLGDPAGAAAAYARALGLRPDARALLPNLGGVLQQAGRLDEARAALRRAVDAPGGAADVASLVNLGVVHHALGEYDDALARLDAAVAREPDHARARRNRALVRLARGDHAGGWADHEHRLRLADEGAAPPAFTRGRPAWDGAALRGERVLLWREQGFGDQIQFARFAALVRQRGGTPVLACSAPLVRLLAGCPGVEAAAADDGPLPPFDLHAPLMSLPFLLGTGGELLGDAVPYLAPAGECPAPLRALGGARGERGPLRVGLAWAGAPGHANDRNRSLPLAALRPLLSAPGTAWYSLQQGAAAAERLQLPADDRARLHDLAPHCADFNDSAHAVAALDLVIAVDTSVAHLAGALGTPVWLLVPRVPDWRWGLEGERTGWYPRARLFRQGPGDGWPAVVERVAAALAAAAPADGRDRIRPPPASSAAEASAR